jgi:hypothetical protein
MVDRHGTPVRNILSTQPVERPVLDECITAALVDPGHSVEEITGGGSTPAKSGCLLVDDGHDQALGRRS